ncbi:MAG: AAA family ATPase [bacterium]|nr:AAA family ATPase [bacterium]
MKIPYGVADFYRLRSRDQVYLDRTDRFAVVEDLGDSLLFLRPRRFGKSLWLSTMASYYDLRLAGEHERLFGDLAIGRTPTPLAHRYFVLRWDFSKIDPDPPPWGVNAEVSSRHERIGNEIRGYLNTSIETFLIDYREHLPEPLSSSLSSGGSKRLGDDPFHNFERLLATIRQTPYRLYLLIDEYDNFANEVLTADVDAYHQLVQSDGPFKYLFKWVKGLLAGAGLDRLFVTGVSPIVMSDVTSGMNVAENVYLYPELNTLCGFTDREVHGLLENLHAEKADTAAPAWTVGDSHAMMRDWYNGYRFALGAEEAVYNPTLVLYFLKHLQRTGASPRQMLDSNLAADEGKLDVLARLATGHDVTGQQDATSATLRVDGVIDLIRRDEPLEIRQLLDRFTLKELLEGSSQDTSFFGSYLYYFGMLTLRKEETEQQTLELVVPNEVMHGLYVERIRRILMPLGASRSAADAILFAFLRSGNLEPLLDFIEATLFPTFSNRDATWANELTVKTVFLTLLWNDTSYVTHSEPELDHRYADLCLLRRPDAQASSLWDLLFEFKRLSLKQLGMSSEDVKAAARESLMEVPKVKDALGEAEGQIVAYRAALGRSRGDTLKLRSFAVVALGFERLVVRSSPS